MIFSSSVHNLSYLRQKVTYVFILDNFKACTKINHFYIKKKFKMNEQLNK